MIRAKVFQNIIILLAILLGFMLFNGIQQSEAGALSGSDFNAGRIIDDAIFYNSGTMTASQIQNFLNVKMPVCDTNGTQPYAGTTRAAYGTSRGVPPPYICLKDYRQTVPAVSSSEGYCSGSLSSGNKSAAQIIYDVSKACSINPQVLLVLLQKEQSLITDDWPWPIQYRSATGYGCPDTAACDSQYYGFFNQVFQAANAFQRYTQNPNWYNYRAGRNNTIYYNPNLSGCGSSQVFIENQATANLYIYTPYQPNQAALNNLYGSGDGCSAYGNRNFWRMFRDWFGSTYSVNLPGCTEGSAAKTTCVWRLRKATTNIPYLVSSENARNELYSDGDYIFDGTYFFGVDETRKNQWNIPVYEFIKPNGENFITSDEGEKNALMSSSFEYNGVAFYANPPSITSNADYAIYRLFHPTTETHVWVSNIPERSSYLAKGYSYEGVAFRSIPNSTQVPPPAEGKLNVYRFYIRPTNSHFYTSSLHEREVLLKDSRFLYEGVEFLSSSSNTTSPVYRLYSSYYGEHLFTSSLPEKDALARNSRWNYEGIAFYANTVGQPVYRMYSNSMNRHFWTTNIAERDNLVNEGLFTNEGVAWYEN